jgi:hypothetical protein
MEEWPWEAVTRSTSQGSADCERTRRFIAVTRPYLEPVEGGTHYHTLYWRQIVTFPFHLHLGLTSRFFPAYFTTEFPCTFFFTSRKCVTCPTHFFHLDMITLVCVFKRTDPEALSCSVVPTLLLLPSRVVQIFPPDSNFEFNKKKKRTLSYKIVLHDEMHIPMESVTLLPNSLGWF